MLCIAYDPSKVLEFFWDHLRPIASFNELKPIDIGIWNLHLLHKFMYYLEQTNSMAELRSLVGGSPRTLYNKIKFANELRLVNWSPNTDLVILSDLGTEYLALRDRSVPQRLSEAQIALLRTFVMRNPYESSVILGIASIVESVFVLSRNTYPVQMSQLTQYFAVHAGKHFDWKTQKAKYNATWMYVNYAVVLGLLGKSGELIYMTPEGFRFTIQMQMHKSVKMVDALTLA